MSDHKVVAAHREGDRVYEKYSDGTVWMVSLVDEKAVAIIECDDTDPDGHVWRAITGSQERPASPVSPELAALREIDKVLDLNWVADIWLNRDETLDAIHAIVRRILPEPHP